MTLLGTVISNATPSSHDEQQTGSRIACQEGLLRAGFARYDETPGHCYPTQICACMEVLVIGLARLTDPSQI